MMRMRTPTFGRLLSLLLTWVTLTALLSPDLPLVTKTIVAGIFVASFWNPGEGLLIAAGLAPLGSLIGVAFDADRFRLTEALVIAFFAGSLLRGWPTRDVASAFRRTVEPKPPKYASAAAWLLAAMVVASIAGVAWQLSRFPGALTSTVRSLAGSYYTTFDRIGIVEGAKLLEGLGLAAATIVLFRRRPALAVQVPSVLAASAICAAGASVLLWRGIGPASILQRYAKIGYRVAAHVGDVNAAGSYFAMALCLALGMSARERGTGRAIWLATSAACAAGLWMSNSRTAFASIGIVLAMTVVWMATRHWTPLLRRTVLVVALAGLVASGAVRARMLERDPDFRGADFRVQFVETSLRAIAAHPLFGIGVGRYYPESHLFLSPQLAWTYGTENAHNNFLQIASEMGIVGFGLFGLWIAGGIASASRALAIAPHDWRLVGALAGVVTFLATCLTGHPLLVREVAFPFWVQFGLVAALGSSTVLNADAGRTGAAIEHAPRRARSALWTAAAALGVLVLISRPVIALREPLAPPASAAVDGFYGWETGADGVRFRWSEKYASVFVPADVTRVEIPVRIPKEGRGQTPMGIDVTVDGVDRGRIIVFEWWTNLTLDLAPAPPPQTLNRINMKMDRTWRPALVVPGSADMRPVAVQVGEYRVIRRTGALNAPPRPAVTVPR